MREVSGSQERTDVRSPSAAGLPAAAGVGASGRPHEVSASARAAARVRDRAADRGSDAAALASGRLRAVAPGGRDMPAHAVPDARMQARGGTTASPGGRGTTASPGGRRGAMASPSGRGETSSPGGRWPEVQAPPAFRPAEVPRPIPARQPVLGAEFSAAPVVANPAAERLHVPDKAEPQRPAVTVVGGAAKAAAPSVERALAGPSARRGDVRPGRVTVVPGGHRPGKPDQLQRDRARAQLPIARPSRIVVLGCTVGAGQTSTALLTGEVLAGLRSGPVAVLDLNPGPSSLAQRALARPALSQAASLAPSRLTVLDASWNVEGADQPGRVRDGGAGDDQADIAVSLAQAAERHEIVIADPSTAFVPRLLAVTDQLVLVAPASTAAASAITMTFEWLEAHGQADLAATAIMVLNGVSRRSLDHVEQAERVCIGRCRAIVRVPWDDQLSGQAPRRSTAPARAHPASQPGVSQPGVSQPGVSQHWAGVLSPGTVGAYTALAGVLVAAQAEHDARDHDGPQPAHAGQARS